MKYITTVDGIEYRVALTGPRAVEVDGQPYTVDLLSIDGGFQYSLLVGADSYEVYVEWCRGEHACFVVLEGRRYRVSLADDRPGLALADRMAEPVRLSEARVTSPMPGLVAAVLVKEGQAVRTGEGLVLLEAMKMENEIRAPMNGIVKETAVAPGQRVAQDDLLVRIGLAPGDPPIPNGTGRRPAEDAQTPA